ncbi:hypothetical protein [Streptomyces griseosporeus]|uniref:hypothetical protein n=1 Tax=Streptomyces griseosporeus TaxID=1910 RepID=UPI003787581A
MPYRPYPNRERAYQQIERHWGPVEPWAAARPRGTGREPLDDFGDEAYRLSTR